MKNTTMKKSKQTKTKSGSRPAAKLQVSRPLAIAKGNPWNAPKVNSRGDNSILINHREFLLDVSSPGAVFSCTQTPINPGLGQTFAWLSHIAANYESYRFRKLEVEYVPIVPATQAGTVMLAMDYDAADAVPLSKNGIMSSQGAFSSPVWSGFKIDCLKPNLMKMAESRYIRGGSLAPNLDIKTYDVANLLVATANTAAFAGVIGELYLSYSVELLTPQYNMADEAFDSSAKIAGTADVTKNNIFGSARTVTGGIPLLVEPAGIQFNEAGDYIIELKHAGAAIIGPPTVATNDASFSYNIITTMIDAAAATVLVTILCRVPNKGTRMFIDYMANAGAITSCYTRLARYLYTLG